MRYLLSFLFCYSAFAEGVIIDYMDMVKNNEEMIKLLYDYFETLKENKTEENLKIVDGLIRICIFIPTDSHRTVEEIDKLISESQRMPDSVKDKLNMVKNRFDILSKFSIKKYVDGAQKIREEIQKRKSRNIALNKAFLLKKKLLIAVSSTCCGARICTSVFRL